MATNETVTTPLTINWFNAGFYSYNGKELTWTRKAKKLIPQSVRRTLLRLYYEEPILKSGISKIKQYGFDEKGFYRGV